MSKTVKQLSKSKYPSGKRCICCGNRASANCPVHGAYPPEEKPKKSISEEHEAYAYNKQDEWEDAVAAVADHQRKHPHLKLPGHLGESAETYLDMPRESRLNLILTQLTDKLFISLQTFIDAVRAACDFHGIALPHLDCEMEHIGPNQGVAYGDLKQGPGFEMNRNAKVAARDIEYVFELKYQNITGGACPEKYLYICANRVKADDSEYWETYAQVVNPSELEELVNMEEVEEVEDGKHIVRQHTSPSGQSLDIEHE